MKLTSEFADNGFRHKILKTQFDGDGYLLPQKEVERTIKPVLDSNGNWATGRDGHYLVSVDGREPIAFNIAFARIPHDKRSAEVQAAFAELITNPSAHLERADKDYLKQLRDQAKDKHLNYDRGLALK